MNLYNTIEDLCAFFFLPIEQNNWLSWPPAFGGLNLVPQASQAVLDHLVFLDLLAKMVSQARLDLVGYLALKALLVPLG